MIVAIDIGNTSCQCAVFSSDGAGEIMGSHRERTAVLSRDNLASALVELATGAAANRSDEEEENTPLCIGIASVVPAATELAIAAAESLFPASLRCFRSTDTDIVEHQLLTPETTGVDRLLGARAAIEMFSDELAEFGLTVIQVGSAVTINQIDSNGQFCGGMILPGAQMWLDALATAACLPNLVASNLAVKTPLAAGRTTESALRAGLAVGLPGAIHNTVLHLQGKNTAGDNLDRVFPPPILTGGGAAAVQSALPFETRPVPDLVLHGIRVVLIRNMNKAAKENKE